MATIQQIAFKNKLAMPEENTYTQHLYRLYMKASLDPVLDMISTRQGKGWAATCRDSTGKGLYALQYNFFSDGGTLSTMAINDYLQARTHDMSVPLETMTYLGWEEQRQQAEHRIQLKTHDFDIKNVSCDSISVGHSSMTHILRSSLSSYENAHKDVQLYLHMSMPKGMWSMHNKPIYSFHCYYDYPWEPVPFVLTQNAELHRYFVGCMTDPDYVGNKAYEVSSIKVKPSAAFNQLLWEAFKKRAIACITDHNESDRLIAIAKWPANIAFAFKNNNTTHKIFNSTAGGVDHYRMHESLYTGAFDCLFNCATQDPEDYNNRSCEWFCSDQDKEDLLADMTLIKLGGD